MLEKFDERERLFLVIGLGFVLVMVLGFAVFKIGDMRARIGEDVATSRNNVNKVQRLRDDIAALPSRGSLPDMNRFLSMTETLLTQHQLKPQNIRNRTEAKKNEEQMVVDLSFNGVPMVGIMNFLYDIEYGQRIEGARVGSTIFRKPLPNRDIYDIKITLVISRPKAAREPRSGPAPAAGAENTEG